MPSARTSVANKEYEYKDKKEVAAKPQQAAHRRGTVLCGGVAVAVALRHGFERTAALPVCQLFFHDDFSEAAGARVLDVWTYGRPYARVLKVGNATSMDVKAFSCEALILPGMAGMAPMRLSPLTP